MKSISTTISFGEDGHLKTSIEDSPDPKPRGKKGNSLLCSTRDFTAIDLETTGNSPLSDDIIEVGAIRYRDGKAVAQFQELVNPGYKVPPFISDMTGISDDMLQEARSLGEILPEFLDFIGDDIVLGHNVHFDVNFIYDACINCELPPFSNDLIDILRISRLLHKDWQSHRLCDIACGLGINNHGWHRSLCDCDVAARCYLKMMDENPDFCEKRSHKKTLKISSITANVDKINESSPLCGKTCVFTGALTISREEAMQIAVNCGAVVKSKVSKNTDYLIMGDQDIRRVGDDGMSSKEEKARALNEAGDVNIVFLGESDFLQMAGSDGYTVQSPDISNPFYGKICVLTGELSIRRDEVVKLVTDLGAEVVSSVSKKVDYLIFGENAGSKKTKAIALNESGAAHITLLNEDEFMRMAEKERAK